MYEKIKKSYKTPMFLCIRCLTHMTDELLNFILMTKHLDIQTQKCFKKMKNVEYT